MRYIYTLSHPITLEIRYIGQTDNLKRRFNEHINESNNKNSSKYNTHKSNWVRKITNDGLIPIINIIDTCENLEESNKMERLYIEHFTNDGLNLTNSYVSDVTEFSVETRKKMSSAKKGKKLEEIVGDEKAIELKKLYSDRMKIKNPNRNDDPLVREKISNTLKEYFTDKNNHWAYGLKMDDAHNEKLRQAKIGNPNNIGNRKPRTEEQKEKIRNSLLGGKVKRSEILQYDLDMNFIKEWKSLREIQRFDNTLSRKGIADNCKFIKSSYAGFIWIYKN